MGRRSASGLLLPLGLLNLAVEEVMQGAAPIGLPSDVAVGVLVGPVDHPAARQVGDRIGHPMLPAFGVVAVCRLEVVGAQPTFRLGLPNALRARCRNLMGSIFFRGVGTFLLLV